MSEKLMNFDPLTADKLIKNLDFIKVKNKSNI